MYHTEAWLNARGFKAEPASTATQEASCTGCVFNESQHLGVKCLDVPCSSFLMGQDVIWIKEKK